MLSFQYLTICPRIATGAEKMICCAGGLWSGKIISAAQYDCLYGRYNDVLLHARPSKSGIMIGMNSGLQITSYLAFVTYVH